MGNLTVARVKTLSTTGLHGDGGTLFLRVAPGGSKSWIQRLTINGRRRDIGLGGWPLVTLAEAREFAFENRRLARRGGDPLAGRRRPNLPTFEQAAVRTFEANRARWRHAKTAINWTGSMARYAYPVFGDRPVDQGRAPRPDPHLDVQAGALPQTPPAHPRRPVLVSGARAR